MNRNVTRLKTFLAQQNLDAILLSSAPNIIYLTGQSLFSETEREGYLIITKKQTACITDGRYALAVKKYIKNFKLLELTASFNFKTALEYFATKENINTLGIEANNLTVNEFIEVKKVFREIKSADLSDFRSLKTTREITNIQKACMIGDLAFEYICKKLRTGVSEIQLAFELEIFIKKNRCEISFPPIVAFGSNTAMPHHKSTQLKLQKNQPVLLDFGVKYKHYCSDMTRTIYFGKAPESFKKTYISVLKTQQMAIEKISMEHTGSTDDKQTQTLMRKIDKYARDYITSLGYPTIPHSLGHGIGLEVHESPRLSPTSINTFKQGMVFSIEPGIYLPDKFGIRIEDLFVFQERGPRKLTKAVNNLLEIDN